MKRNTGLFAVTMLLFLAVLACTAPFAATPIPTTDATATPTNPPFSGPPPQVTIESPGANAQAVLNQSFTVRAHATDGVGVTRVEMHEAGRIVAIQPSASSDRDLVALLEYRPAQLGSVKLEVIAYRGSVGSDPVVITVGIVANAAQLANPNSLDPTSGVAAGAACTARVNVSGLALRSGPGVNFKSITTLSTGETLNVVGRNADSSWFAVRRKLGANGCVSDSYTKPTGDCSAAPVTSATVAP